MFSDSGLSSLFLRVHKEVQKEPRWTYSTKAMQEMAALSARQLPFPYPIPENWKNYYEHSNSKLYDNIRT